MRTWRSSTTVHATPERVIDTLTDTDACARWSPVPFGLDDGAGRRLRAGTTTRVSGRLLGIPVRLDVETLAVDRSGLRLRAKGPIELLVDYALRPTDAGCALDARVSLRPRRSPGGRIVARATRVLLAAGTLDHALQRMAHEAERAA